MNIIKKLATSLHPSHWDRPGLPYLLGISGLLILISTSFSLQLISSINVEALIIFTGVILLILAVLVYRRQHEARVATNLQNAEIRYKRIFDHALEGIYQSTADGRFQSVNPALVSMLGYESAEQLLSPEFYIPRDLYFNPDKRNETIYKLTEHRHITNHLIQGKRQDGSAVWLSLSARAEQDEDGNTFFNGFVRDVSEAEDIRRQAAENQQALQLSEQRSRTLIDTIPDLLLWFTADGDYLEVILRDWFIPAGIFSAEEVIGKNVREVLPPVQANVILNNLNKAIETGETQTYRWGPSVHGKYAEARATPGADGNVLVISHDITQEVLAEMTLLRRDAIMSAIGFSTEQLLRTNSWQDVIHPVLKRLGEATSNVASANIFELSELSDGTPAIAMRHEWIADNINPRSKPLHVSVKALTGLNIGWFEQLNNDEIVHTLVKDVPRGLLADMLSERDILEIVLIPIKVGEKCWGFIGFDINSAEFTWSTQEHEALRIAAANLGAAIEREQSQKAFLEIQKSESIGILAGGIAHDFNNLLTGVIGQSSLAEAKLGVDHPVTKHVTRAVRSAKKAANLTKQLLAYAGKGQIIVLPVNLNALVTENVELFATALPSNVSVSYALDAVNSIIVADKVHMQQLVMNLVINAGDAMSETGGNLSVTSCNELLTEPLRDPHFRGSQELAPGDYFVLVVADTGIGMSEMTLSKIFDPYFTTKETGHGLGLSATLGIVNTLNGALCVQTEVDKGTTFSVWLPLDSQPEDTLTDEVDTPVIA